MSIEDRVVNLEQAFLALMKRDDERYDTVGESIKLLTEMIEHHEKRLDGVHSEQSNADTRIAALADAQIRTEASQSHADERIAALADAQIRTEDALKGLSAAQLNADERIAALADAQIRTEASQSHADERIAALADAHTKTEEALAKLTGKLDRLADTVERHIKEGH